MNRYRHTNINRLIWKRGFSDKKKTLFKPASYVSEENMLAYFFMMFYADEVAESMGRVGMQMDQVEGQIHLADCLPNLNLIYLKWNTGKAQLAKKSGFLKKFIFTTKAATAKAVNFIAGKKVKICFVYSKYFAIIKKYITTKKSRLVESNVINDYLKLLVFLDRKSRRCFYTLHSFPFFKTIKKYYLQMTHLTSGFSRTIKNLTGSRKAGKCVIWGVGVCLLLALLLPTGVCAENVKYDSLLVWRADGAGDYTMPVIAANSRYVSLPVIVSKSLITSVTVTWAFEGEVSMEVSADGGSHFTPVVCGLPLTKDFTQGTNLRWRATVGLDSSLSEVRISYKDASGLEGSFGTPELSGFPYRKKFIIKNTGLQPLYNYQVNLKLGEADEILDADVHCSGQATGDFKSIRFTLADGKTLIPYYLENISGASDKRVAEFVLKIPQIPVGPLPLYVYYGSSQAENLSDGRKVFDFYDDFKSDELNKDVWRESLLSGGSVAMDSGGLVLDAASILTKDFVFHSGLIEFSSTLVTGNEARLIIRQGDSQLGTDKSQVAYSSTYSGAQHCIAVGDIVKANEPNAVTQGVTYDYSVKVLGDEITFERYSQAFGEKQASITYIDTNGLKEGSLGLKAAAVARGANATVFHWVRVRKYVEPSPIVDTEQTSEEEKVNSAYFDGIALSAKGNLVVKEGYREGIYITPVTLASLEVRIISPSWEGEGARVDITADGGKSAYLNCDNFNYYYAPEGDFESGTNIKARVVLKNKDAFLKELNLQYAAGKIVLLAPNGTEIVNTGLPKEISWTAWDYDKTYPIKIELSLDGGKTYSLITDRANNTGAYSWRVPVNADLFTTDARIRISDANDAAVFDTSDADFAILPPGLDVEQYDAIIAAGGRVSLAGKAVYGASLDKGEQKVYTATAVGGTQSVTGETTETTEAMPISERKVPVFDLNSLLETGGRRSGTKLYDLLIKVSGNQNLDSAQNSAGLYKTGDVVLAKPHGYNWSETERNSYLIIQVYLTDKEAADVMSSGEDLSGTYTEDHVPIPSTQRRNKRVNIEKFGITRNDVGKKTFQAMQAILEGNALKVDLIEEK
ncbi:MAG: DUF2341 domain-containing protein [Candidatus Omnitrophota bacterium]